jgi:hypothetical protein
MVRQVRTRVVVGSVLLLAAAADAHRIIESGHAGGKVVLDLTGAALSRR